MPQPSLGRVVHYRLTPADAEAIQRRRTTSKSIAERIKAGTWSEGVQAHFGNPASAGELVPVIVTAVWPDEFGTGIPGVNGQALLDGNDSLWICSAREGTEVGQWRWPEIVR